MKPIILVCLDGCSWNDLQSANMPNLEEVARANCSVICSAMVPTVTNVNNASILTGEFPSKHGITGNSYLDRVTNSETYMDSSRFLRCDTFLSRASKLGLKTLLLTVKDKLRRLLAEGVVASFSLERPCDWAVEEVGRPPDVYSSEASIWLLAVALEGLKKGFDVVYVSTTDYVAHKYGPRSSVTKGCMEEIDKRVGLFLEQDAIFGLVSDHGMNRKRIKVDLEKVLLEREIRARVLPIIRDEYIEHHQNLGGAVYLFLEDRRQLANACEVLSSLDEIDEALTYEEANLKFSLPIDRIGEILVLGGRHSVFGAVRKGEVEEVDLRSHGSLHERRVPFIANIESRLPHHVLNKDAFQILFEAWSLLPKSVRYSNKA